ncbi:MAG: class I SAM-dependent methyltransferase [Clostridia bacterium]|nr:class I SAM-dependent methyltransferase [Clostridia bacterium]
MSYDSFAKYYDCLMADADYSRRAEYYHDILTSNGAGKGILLDLGCGTGNMSVLMNNFGYEVIGTDSSVGMLMKAREKTAGLDILLLNQPMEELDLYGTVDCAISALDCINHLSGKEAVQKAFDSVSLFMVKDGVFVFDVNTVFKHRTALADNCYVIENDDVYCVWQNSLCEDDSIDISLDFFTEENGVYTRESEYFTERAYPVSEIESMLGKAGFETLAIYDDLTFSPVRDDSLRAVFVAKKR